MGAIVTSIDPVASYFRMCRRDGVDDDTAKRALWQARLKGWSYYDAYRLARDMIKEDCERPNRG